MPLPYLDPVSILRASSRAVLRAKGGRRHRPRGPPYDGRLTVTRRTPPRPRPVLIPIVPTHLLRHVCTHRGGGSRLHDKTERCGTMPTAFPTRHTDFQVTTAAPRGYATRYTYAPWMGATFDQRPNGLVNKVRDVARRIVCKVAVRPVSTCFRRDPRFRRCRGPTKI